MSKTPEAIQQRRDMIKKHAARGLNSYAIASMMGISVRTVERHRPAEAQYQARVYNRANKTGVDCAICNRRVGRDGLTYRPHGIVQGDPQLCTNSRMPLPVIEGTAHTHTHRLRQVMNLASVVQDEDPAHADTYLTGLSAREVQAIAIFALAAIDLDRTKAELWPDWTRQLKVGA